MYTLVCELSRCTHLDLSHPLSVTPTCMVLSLMCLMALSSFASFDLCIMSVSSFFFALTESVIALSNSFLAMSFCCYLLLCPQLFETTSIQGDHMYLSHRVLLCTGRVCALLCTGRVCVLLCTGRVCVLLCTDRVCVLLCTGRVCQA